MAPSWSATTAWLAAGCTLPLSEADLPADYGMRHRAALGMAERTDAVVVVVSEERGTTSLASNGRMAPDIDEVRLNRQLHRLFGLELDEPTWRRRRSAPPPRRPSSVGRRR